MPFYSSLPWAQHLTTRKEISVSCKLGGFTTTSPFQVTEREVIHPAPTHEGGTVFSAFFCSESDT